jgi:D-alanine-D-alanine ligase
LKIGLTFDLRSEYLARGFSQEETAEFDSRDTIDALEEALASLGHEVQRVGNIYRLVELLGGAAAPGVNGGALPGVKRGAIPKIHGAVPPNVNGVASPGVNGCATTRFSGRAASGVDNTAGGGRWDLVFNVCEGLYGKSREAQVPALLDAFCIPYTFSDPVSLCLCHDKDAAKRIISHAGIPTPEFFSVDSIDKLDENIVKLRPDGLKYPLFVKPVSEGTGKGIDAESVVWDFPALKNRAACVIEKYRQAAIVETYLPGREFTVGVLGTGDEARAVGVMEVKLKEGAEPGVYSYANKERCEELVEYVLVEDAGIVREAVLVVLSAYRALGLRDAARIDIRADSNGRLNFIEANPLAGLHPWHSDLPIMCTKAGMSYRELIGHIVDSAARRI